MPPMRSPSRPRPPLSQVFLDDVRVARGIAQSLGPSRGSKVLEVGPGKGILTRALLDEGWQVLAVDRDKELAAGLRQACPGGSEGSRLKVVNADILEFPLDRASKAGYVHLAGNLPYHITGMIFRTIFEAASSLKTAVVMIQDEVAERMVSSKGSQRSLLTLAAELHCASLEKLFTVPPSAFRPRPHVQSAVLRLRFREEPLLDPRGSDLFFLLLKAAFGQKRKTLQNNLADLAGSKPVAAEKLAAAGIDPSRRAETLSLEEALRLEKAFR